MTLALPSVDPLPSDPRARQRAASQWFTPDEIADRLVRWLGSPPGWWRVLEPSAGSGALVRAILAHCPAPTVDAVELDHKWADHLRALEVDPAATLNVDCADYLTRPAPEQPYDVAVLNPPYEDGLDGRFIAKAMAESLRVVALVRLATLAGSTRHREVWSQVDSGAWHLAGVAIFASRPVFIAPGAESTGGMTDFVAVKMRRASADLGASSRTSVEWWT